MIDPTFLALVFGAVGSIGGAGVAWGTVRHRIHAVEAGVRANGENLQVHDERTRVAAEKLARIETNIEWIKNKLETRI